MGRTSPGQSSLHLQLADMRLIRNRFPPLNQTGGGRGNTGHTGQASKWDIAGNLLILFSMNDGCLIIASDFLIQRTLDSL